MRITILETCLHPEKRFGDDPCCVRASLRCCFLLLAGSGAKDEPASANKGMAVRSETTGTSMTSRYDSTDIDMLS
jgi:hypothetical protein